MSKNSMNSSEELNIEFSNNENDNDSDFGLNVDEKQYKNIINDKELNKNILKQLIFNVELIQIKKYLKLIKNIFYFIQNLLKQ